MKAPWKTKNRAIIWSTSGHKSAEKHDPKGYMHSSVHSSTIHNSQDMEVMQISIDRRMDHRPITHMTVDAAILKKMLENPIQ